MWEAFEHAAHYELDNLTAIIDVNRLGQRGETMVGWDLDTYVARAEAFGWNAIEIDGHDVEAIDEAFAAGRRDDREADGRRRADDEGQGRRRGREPERLPRQAARRPRRGDRRARRAARRPRSRSRSPRRRLRRATGRGAARAPALRARHRGRDPQGVRRRARGARRGATRRRRARRRGLELDVRRDLREGASRAVLRDVHRRAAAGRGRGRPPGRRLAAVRVDVRGVPLARLRLRPHGRDQPRDVRALRLARRRLDRRGRPVADGARGHRVAPRGPRLDRAPPVRREPDREARRGDGRHARGSRTSARSGPRRRCSTRPTRSSRSAAAASSARATTTRSRSSAPGSRCTRR